MPDFQMADTTVEGFLQHHQNIVIHSAVEAANQLAEKEALRHQRDHEVMQWRRERQELLDALDVASGFARTTAGGAAAAGGVGVEFGGFAGGACAGVGGRAALVTAPAPAPPAL